MTIQTSRSLCRLSVRALFLFALLPLWTACGGGGGGTAADTTPDDPVLDLVDVQPAVVDAGFNTVCTIEGGTFAEPVTCRMLDEDGNVLGPDRPGRVTNGGDTVEMETPIIPDLAEDIDVILEVRDGNGRVARGRNPTRMRRDALGARSIDGSGNNPQTDGMGQAGTALRADVTRNYEDGIASPSGTDRPNVRDISNAVCAQDEDMPEASGAADMFWLWGQFLDHDLDLTGEADPEESFDIAIPTGDPYFDPFATGTQVMPFHRSAWLADTGTDAANPRLQPNQITSWIDASNVYGSDDARAAALRTNDGTGRLRTSAGDLLPFNTAALPNAPTAFDPSFFLAGDVRCNENVALTAMHTIWMREHNRIADDLRARNEHLTGDQVYEAARRRVGAMMQVITVREFLPLLLGQGGLGQYRGYDPGVDGSIGVLFSTAAYRFGHSMVSGTLSRLDETGAEHIEGSLSLTQAFFNPSLYGASADLIEALMRGAAGKAAQSMDALMVDELRNLLFGPPGAGGLDLAALNLQRGRDHGLPSYNAARVHFGRPAAESFADVSSDADVQARLAAVYASVDEIDPWVGALSEDRRPGALVGETLYRVFRDQFRRLRDGDRFWYENVFRGEALQRIERTRLADVIRRNSSVDDEISDDVFRVGDGGGPRPPRGLTALTAPRDAEELRALVGAGLIR